MNIIDAIHDPNLFGDFLGNDLTTWRPWLTALRVLHGLPVNSKRSHKLIQKCTGRDPRKLPKGGFDTALFLTGRRSGKSRMSSVIGAYAAVLAGLEKRLAKGEKGVVPIICPTKSQGRIIKSYLRAIFDAPLLQAEVIDEQKDGFTFRNGVRVEILPGDFRHVRGYTILTAICDEICFFGLSEESRVRSDSELVRSLTPAMATCAGRLICIGSPYARKGWSWQTYKNHWGNDKGSILVWNAPSRTMNETLPQRVVDAALAEDLEAAKSEYLGEFRDDVGIFLPREVIENLVIEGRQELLFNDDRTYFGFVDISGGRSDASALAIAHRENRKFVVDYVRLWRSPSNPHEVISDMVSDLAKFGIRKVTGDNYAAEFVATAFKSRGIAYTKADKPKSQLYAELLPILCSNQIELLDNETLVNQLAGLERRTRSGGKDIIDHPPGNNCHDDLANAVAGVAVCCSARRIRAGGLTHPTIKKGVLV